MSEQIKDGGPAFPMPTGHAPAVGLEMWNKPQWGMTLRDYFAAKALQGALTNDQFTNGLTYADKAEWVYEMSDAMLKARQQGSAS
jgi:hypothetical protein